MDKTKKKSPPSFGEADYLYDHPFDLVRCPLPDDILVEGHNILMRDGIYLSATVFRPKVSFPVPVITTGTPYGKNNYNQWDYFRDAPIGSVPGGGFYLGKLTISDHTPFEAPDPGFWAPNGYAVMIVDAPGYGGSQSNPIDGPGPESRWFDVMSWLEAQPWCTGQVGMNGVSALCVTQWIAAKDKAPPQLKAIVPWEGYNETGRGGGYGGIPEKAFAQWLREIWLEPNFTPNALEPEPYFSGWTFDVASTKIPALVCASFSDQELHTFDSFGAFVRMSTPHKWLYNHRRQKWGAYYAKEALELQKRFFDRFLKGDEQAMEGVPRVRLEINQSRFEYKVVETDSWPVENTQYTRLYLDALSGMLEMTPPNSESSCVFAPLPAGDLNNRACFNFKFESDTDVVGDMFVKLFIEAIETDNVDLFVGVEKYDQAGNKVFFFSASGGNANGPVARGWLRASKRTLDVARSTEWRPVLDLKEEKPLRPNKITEVIVPIMPSGTIFLAGETLRLLVQSWSVPGEWEGGETREWDTLSKGQCRIHTGKHHPSFLMVPIVSFVKENGPSSILNFL